MKRSVRRATAVIALVVLSVLVWAPIAQAAGIWDPNDVRGRLDIRWIGVRYTQDGDAILTVTLYDGFRTSALPKKSTVFDPNALAVYLDEHTQGYFFRKHGDIRLSFGDHASNCCSIYGVQRPNATTLEVRYEPIDESDPGFRVYGASTFGRARDETGTFRIGPPP